MRSGEVATEPAHAPGEEAQALIDAVRAAIVEHRQEDVLAELEGRLLTNAGLEVDKEVLYRLSVPDL